MGYVPIRLSTLKPDISFGFDVYIKLQTKFILYVRSGDDIQEVRLTNLKQKKVRQLFIDETHEEQYQEFLDGALNKAMNDPNMSNIDRAASAARVSTGAVEDIHEDPESIATFKMVERAAKGIVNVIGKREGVLKEFLKTMKDSGVEFIFKHAVSVSSLATCLGEHYKLKEQDLQNLGVAAMMLDIGMIKMKEEHRLLFAMPFEQFSKEDWVIYKQHPEIAYEMLKDKDWINQDILALILGHEERKSGGGFPKGTKNLKVTQEILGICSAFDRMVSCLGMSHKEAMSEFQINEVGNFDLEMIKSFKEVLKKQGVYEI